MPQRVESYSADQFYFLEGAGGLRMQVSAISVCGEGEELAGSLDHFVSLSMNPHKESHHNLWFCFTA